MEPYLRLLMVLMAVSLPRTGLRAAEGEIASPAIHPIPESVFPTDLKICKGVPVVLQVELGEADAHKIKPPEVVFDLVEGMGWFKDWDKVSLRRVPAWKRAFGYLSYVFSYGRIKIQPDFMKPPAALFYPLGSVGDRIHIRARLTENGEDSPVVDFQFTVGADREAAFRELREKYDQSQAVVDHMNYRFDHSWTFKTYHEHGDKTTSFHVVCRYLSDKIEINSDDPAQSKVTARVHADPKVASEKDGMFYWGETGGHLIGGHIIWTQGMGGRAGILMTSYLNATTGVMDEDRTYSSLGGSQDLMEYTQVNGVWMQSHSVGKYWSVNQGITSEDENFYSNIQVLP